MFFTTAFVKSCYDRTWLTNARTKPGAAWSYFFLFSFAATVLALLPALFLLPTAINKVKTAVAQNVPSFTATIHKGQLNITGVAQPFVYNVPEADGKFVVVVDTVSTSSPGLAKFLQPGQSGVLLSRNLLEIYRADRDESRTQSWMGSTDGTITKTDLMKGINALTYRGTLFIIGLVVFVFVYLGVSIGRLVSLFFVTLLVYIIAAIAKHRWAFGQLFTMGLYATTVPTILAVVLPLLGIAFSRIYGVALLAFMLAVVFTKDDKLPVPGSDPFNPPSH